MENKPNPTHIHTARRAPERKNARPNLLRPTLRHRLSSIHNKHLRRMGKTSSRRSIPATRRIQLQNGPNRRVISRKWRNLRWQLGRRHGRRHLIHHRRNTSLTRSRNAYGHNSSFCFNDTRSRSHIRTLNTENTTQTNSTCCKVDAIEDLSISVIYTLNSMVNWRRENCPSKQHASYHFFSCL